MLSDTVQELHEAELQKLRLQLDELRQLFLVETSYRCELGKLLNMAIEDIRDAKVKTKQVWSGLLEKNIDVHSVVYTTFETDARTKALQYRMQMNAAHAQTHNPKPLVHS